VSASRESGAAESRPWLCEAHGVLVHEGECPDCAEDEREEAIERAERLAEEDRFLYGI